MDEDSPSITVQLIFDQQHIFFSILVMLLHVNADDGIFTYQMKDM